MGQSGYDTYEEGSAGEHIWLRYATRFAVGAREYTLEMGVPMPIGASEEEREQLLREADAGMNQLAGFVENKVALMLQRVPPNQGPLPMPKPTERPSTPFAPASPASVAPVASPAARATRPPAMPPAPGPAQPAQSTQSALQATSREHRDGRDYREQRDGREIREAREESERYGTQVPTPALSSQRDAMVPPARPSTGATMQLAGTGDTGGNLTLPQFISTIRDTMSLNPKQAMEMLHVKSLNNINLRDALEKLRAILEGENTNGAAPTSTTSKAVVTPTGGNQKTRDIPTSSTAEEKTFAGKPTQTTQEAQAERSTSTANPTATPTPTGGNAALNIPGLTRGTASLKSVPKEPRPIYTFDEEEEEPAEDEDDLDDVLEDLDEEGEEGEEEELTPQQRAQARALINQFRESRGPTVANAARLQVLHNVVIGQIDENELLDLIQGIWDVNSVKKLKVDQAELLISWAKTDEFYDEVRAVLAVLDEEI